MFIFILGDGGGGGGGGGKLIFEVPFKTPFSA